MARVRKRTTSKSKQSSARKLPYHAFWSGSLSFGLVNVPVLVFPATRHSGVRLRMISPEGSLLERRFFCPKDGKEVHPDEIVRGYELDNGSYITVDDDELEALEPQKTREIDLREFVDLGELSPAFLERGYYLTPLKEATKAYRLLADVMERTRRAGIATFVMREREYLVAIFAREGILCAETLRFRDELRDPEAIGLPKPAPADRRRVAAFERATDALFAKTIALGELADKSTKALKAIIERKQKAGRDLIRSDHEAAEDDSEVEEQVDLLETIRRSLRHSRNGAVEHHRAAGSSSNGASGKSGNHSDGRALRKQPAGPERPSRTSSIARAQRGRRISQKRH
jgi:DNA end-binding protein Ku